MRYFLLQIKWAYQRVVQGYDDRVYWQFDSYFIQIIPALKKFCVNQLQDTQHMNLNGRRCEVYRKTLELIQEWETPDVRKEGEFTIYDWTAEDKKLAKLAEYFGKNINIYWD